MKQRFGRVVVVLVLVATAVAAAQQAIARSRHASASEARLTGITANVAKADAALAELAASERAYVAPGQGLDFWAGKVDESLASAREALARLDAPAALSRLDDFAAMDLRARDYMGNGQRTLAADLIFTDGYEILAGVRTEAAAAASLAYAGLTPAVSRDRQIHVASIAALGVCALIGALLFLRTPRPAHPALAPMEPVTLVTPARVAAGGAEDPIGAALDASLEGIATVPPSPAAPDAPVQAHAPAPARPAVDLPSAADICIDLGRLLDARDLEHVLARIATVFNASGVIVWMTDRAAGTLSPALTHGYPASLLARLGPLPLSDANATTSAARTGETQVVDGAIAVPMLTADGCTGVLALEIRDGKERASDLQSLARIVAAQLATTISGTAAETEPRRAAEA